MDILDEITKIEQKLDDLIKKSAVLDEGILKLLRQLDNTPDSEPKTEPETEPEAAEPETEPETEPEKDKDNQPAQSYEERLAAAIKILKGE